MSPMDIYCRAPLGAKIRFSNGEPRPPERFTRKVKAWENDNGTGMLVEYSPGCESTTYSHPPTFALHLATYSSGGVQILVVRRIYSVASRLDFEIVERPRPGMARVLTVSWTYPADELIALRAAETERVRAAPVATGIDLPSLNFAYRIGGDKVPWRPVRAFDDGRRLFVEFGAAIATVEMPPLFAVSEKGDAELLNYRVQGHFMIVDRLFERGELRLGAGKAMKKVRIVRNAAPSRGRP